MSVCEAVKHKIPVIVIQVYFIRRKNKPMKFSFFDRTQVEQPISLQIYIIHCTKIRQTSFNHHTMILKCNYCIFKKKLCFVHRKNLIDKGKNELIINETNEKLFLDMITSRNGFLLINIISLDVDNSQFKLGDVIFEALFRGIHFNLIIFI